MKYLFLLVFVIILNGCGNVKSGPKQSSETSALSQGFDLVDQGRFDEAIIYFQKMYTLSPSDEVLKAWASAYIARSGLKIARMYEALSTFPRDTQVTKENILVQIKAYRNGLESIPYVKGEARADVQSASAILQMRKTSSVRLLRGILNLVLLRSTFSDGDKTLLNVHFTVDLDENMKLICKLDWKKLRSWLQAWTFYGLELKQDLDIAYPAKIKTWNAGEKFFFEARNLSTTIVRACN